MNGKREGGSEKSRVRSALLTATGKREEGNGEDRQRRELLIDSAS